MKAFLGSFVLAIALIGGGLYKMSHPSAAEIFERAIHDPDTLRQMQDSVDSIHDDAITQKIADNTIKASASAQQIPTLPPRPNIELKPLPPELAAAPVVDDNRARELQAEVDRLTAQRTQDAQDAKTQTDGALNYGIQYGYNAARADLEKAVREAYAAGRSAGLAAASSTPVRARPRPGTPDPAPPAGPVEIEIRGKDWFKPDGTYGGRIDRMGGSVMLEK